MTEYRDKQGLHKYEHRCRMKRTRKLAREQRLPENEDSQEQDRQYWKRAGTVYVSRGDIEAVSSRCTGGRRSQVTQVTG